MSTQPSALSKPIRIGDRVALNRIVYQPMEANDAGEQGAPSERTLGRYRRYAEGGPGVLFVEAVGVCEESRGRVNQLQINSETLAAMGRLVAAIREANPDPLVLFQLSHDGRNSGSFSRRVSAFPSGEPGVEVLSAEEIDEVGDRVARAAAMVRSIGADGIDFKHCHGYLFCELLRPANRRDDRYGGSFENRTRFFSDTMEKIRREVRDPSFLVGCRLSVYEPEPGGFGTAGAESEEEDLEEPLAFVRLMEDAGLHYVNASLGRPLNVPARNEPEAVLQHFRVTETIRKATRLPVMGAAYSLLRNGDNRLEGSDPEKKSLRWWAERNVAEGRVDLVGVGRQSFADPLFAKKLLTGEGEIDYCTLCNGCRKLLAAQKEAGCTVYDPHYRTLLRSLNREQ